MPRFKKYSITPLQCEIARKALCWSRADLAEAAGCGTASVGRFELNYADPDRSFTADRMQNAFESAGIVFIENGLQYPPERDKPLAR